LEDRLVPAMFVTSLADSGLGTLRNEVATALSGSTIYFSKAGVIHLTTGEILINKDLTIIGEDGKGNAVPVIINGSNRNRIFEVAVGKNVTLKELTLTDGYARASSKTVPGTGGAVLSEGNLTVDTVVFNYNRALVSGGAIETTTGTSGTLTVVNSTFKGNRAITGSGGAISANDGMRLAGNEGINVLQSKFYDNWAAVDGGAINFDYPALAPSSGTSGLNVNGSLFQSNNASDGGGIHFSPGHPIQTGSPAMSNSVLNVLNSTFDSNAAFGAITASSHHGNGGGIDLSMDLSGNSVAAAFIRLSTFAGNWANYGGAINTIVQTTGNAMGTVTIDRDSVSSNQAVAGGGIYTTLSGASTRQTTVRVTNSTVNDNVATSFQTGASVYNAQGGGMFAAVTSNVNTLLDYVNDTVAYNSAVTSTPAPSSANGGGIYIVGIGPAQTVSLNSLTVAYNFADNDGGGLWVPPLGAAPLQPWVRNCAFDLNTAGGSGPDVFGIVTSKGYNILSTFNSSFSVLDVQGAGDLKLDTILAANGGPTLTLLPQTSSPMLVIGQGFPSPSQFDDPTADQRGVARSKPTSKGAVDPG
jgi:predicted outer membrane repeat protein